MASNLIYMGEAKRKPLEAWQRQDTARLKKLWDDKKADGTNRLSQMDFANEYGIGTTQGSVSHYLTGKQPLNLPVAVKFGRGLKAKVSDFSPTLAKLLPTDDGSPTRAPGAIDELSPKEEILLHLIRGLFSFQQIELMTELRALFESNQITRKELGQKPLRGVSNEAVARAFGKVPTTTPKGKKVKSKRSPGLHAEEDPE